MHILYLIPQDAESPYGNGRALPIATALSEQGHQVTVLMLHANYAACEQRQYALNDNLHVRVVAQSHVKKIGNQKSYFNPVQLIWVIFMAIWQLYWVGRSIQADLILIGKAQPQCGIAGLRLARQKGIACWLDADDYEAASNRFSSAIQQWALAVFERALCCRVDQVLTNTDFMVEKIANWCAAQTVQKLPNGITQDWLIPPTELDTQQLRQTLKISLQSQVIGFIGSLSSPSHPVELLLDAFQQVLKTQPNTGLLIVGGGEDWQPLQDHAQQIGIADACHFTGKVAPIEVKKYYALCDVCIEPLLADDAALSRAPLKLFEAWATNVPFLTSLVGERAQLYAGLPIDWFPEPDDVNALANKIEAVLTTPQIATALQQHGKEQIQRFTWDTLVQGLLSA